MVTRKAPLRFAEGMMDSGGGGDVDDDDDDDDGDGDRNVKRD